MICVSVGAGSFKTVKALVEKPGLAEIRLDLVRLTRDEIRELFSLSPTLIATCRPGRHAPEEREAILREAVRAGAAYVDIELDAPARLRSTILRDAARPDFRIIVSYHNFRSTPPRTVLEKKLGQCIEAGAHVAKIACRVRKTADVGNLLSLYGQKIPNGRSILALGMGDMGTITRVAAPFLGAPFTYAAPDAGSTTAPGQMNKTLLEKILELLNGGNA